MFDKSIYQQRRKGLKKSLGGGLILMLGNEPSPMNYMENQFPFVQDSSFLYFWGGNKPYQAGLIDLDEGQDHIFGHEPTIEEVVWNGPQPGLAELKETSGADQALKFDSLAGFIQKAVASGRRIHILPPYRGETKLRLMALLGLQMGQLKAHVSSQLIKAVVALREIKSDEEVAQIEQAIEITREMILMSMATIKPGDIEIQADARANCLAEQRYGLAYPMILTDQGQFLHIRAGQRVFSPDRLVVQDCGAKSEYCYAADLTRTYPLSGKFSAKQKAVYEVVYNAQMEALKACRPGVENREVYRLASASLTNGLKDLGIMKGNAEEAVAEGAHTLFFPCGIGHALGMDVHDMEDLGEDYVGYTDKIVRDPRFGFNRLRLAKPLETGMVITVEPGVYFVPGLVAEWKAENRLERFIDYAKLEEYMDVGGIRVEDDIVITSDGHRVLGRHLAKTIEEVEEITSQNQ
jgi:Xaa-Pro aminopeptidase